MEEATIVLQSCIYRILYSIIFISEERERESGGVMSSDRGPWIRLFFVIRKYATLWWHDEADFPFLLRFHKVRLNSRGGFIPIQSPTTYGTTDEDTWRGWGVESEQGGGEWNKPIKTFRQSTNQLTKKQKIIFLSWNQDC